MSAPALPAGTILPLTRRLTGAPDPLALYAALSDGGSRPGTLFLESADTTTGVGDRSVIMSGACARLACRGRTVTVESLNANGEALIAWMRSSLSSRPETAAAAQVEVGGALPARSLVLEYPAPGGDAVNERQRLLTTSPLDVLRLVVRGPSLATAPLDLSHFAAGIIAYDLLELYETLPPPAIADEEPLFEMWVADRFIVIDHRRQSATVVACAHGGEGSDGRYHDATRAIEQLAAAAERAHATTSGLAAAVAARSVNGERSPESAAAVPPPTTDLDDDAYADIVRRLQRHIAAGDVFQIVPSRGFSLPCLEPLAAYSRLRASNPSPYMFYVRGDARTLFGTSPETCVKVYAADGENGRCMRVRLKPIAGTAARGLRADGSLDRDLDVRREAALRLDAKEAAEHLMLVDLARNDVARVSRPGTRDVTQLLTVERFSRVMHLVSEVEGELDAGLDALHAYAASLNMGTLVGAPKVRAAQLLRGVEPHRRGPYGGAVGYFAANGEMDTAIVIRSAVVQGGVAEVRAGAGVVLDSEPYGEAAETRRKAEAVLRALAPQPTADLRR